MGLLFDFIYHKKIVHRYDDNLYVFYYAAKDFPGLIAEPFSFPSMEGCLLKGYFYSYPGYKKDHLIVFVHGLGGGHRSYLREIEFLCSKGFQVIGYDMTGCFESEGEDIRGFTQSLSDLKSCLAYLRSRDFFLYKKISVIGHSIGGYACGNILNDEKDLHSATVISGFCSIPILAGPLFRGFGKAFIAFEKKANPDSVYSSMIDALKSTDKNVLVIQDRNDPVVPFSTGLGKLKSQVDNPHVTYFISEGKGHNPNYTKDAATYMNESFRRFNFLVKKKKIRTLKEKQDYMNQLDFRRMTAQDEEVWSRIIANILR